MAEPFKTDVPAPILYDNMRMAKISNNGLHLRVYDDWLSRDEAGALRDWLTSVLSREGGGS